MSNADGQDDLFSKFLKALHEQAQSSNLFDDLTGPNRKSRAESELKSWRESFYDAVSACDFFQKKLDKHNQNAEKALSKGDWLTYDLSAKKSRSAQKKLRLAQRDLRDAQKMIASFEEMLSRWSSMPETE